MSYVIIGFEDDTTLDFDNVKSIVTEDCLFVIEGNNTYCYPLHKVSYVESYGDGPNDMKLLEYTEEN